MPRSSGPSYGPRYHKNRGSNHSFRKNPYSQEDRGYKIAFTNLDPDVAESDIHELFMDVGRVTKVVINYDNFGCSKGTGEVAFETKHGAQKAIEEYNEAEIDDRPMYLTFVGSIGKDSRIVEEKVEEEEEGMDDLKTWLEENDMVKYHQKLVTKGIETTEDLTFLSKTELTEIAAEIGMNLRVRKKFIVSIGSLSWDPPPYSPSRAIPSFSIATAALCAKHSKPFWFICENDNSLVCGTCIETDHRGHTLKTIEKAAEEERQELQTTLKTLQEKIDDMKEGIMKFKKVQSQLHKDGEEVEKKIHTYFEKFRHACDEREEKLISQVKKMINYDTDLLFHQEKIFSTMLEESNKIFHDAENVLKNEGDAHFLQRKDSLRQKINLDRVVIPEPPICDRIAFEEDSSLLNSLAHVGKISGVS